MQFLQEILLPRSHAFVKGCHFTELTVRISTQQCSAKVDASSHLLWSFLGIRCIKDLADGKIIIEAYAGANLLSSSLQELAGCFGTLANSKQFPMLTY